MMHWLNFVVSLVMLIINIFVIVYLDRLEQTGCQCSRDWRRTFAFSYLIAAVIQVAFMAFMAFVMIPNIKSFGPTARRALFATSAGLMFLMSIASILYVIFSLQYVHRLRDQKCLCSEKITRDVWEILLYIYVALFAIGILQAFMFIVTFDYNSKMVELTGKKAGNTNSNSGGKKASNS